MISKPTLLLDEHKCKANITFMAERAKQFNVELRPHFKTHQSLEIGRWFKDVGVTKITTSSLDMANYFSKEWNDITVAFPVNILEIDTINNLASSITLNVLIESETSLKFLKKHLQHPVNFYIKINIGNNRAGLLHYDTESIDALLKTSKNSDKLNFIGFLGHAGQTYKCRSKTDIISVHEEAKKKLVSLKNQYKSHYPNIIASYGDTPSCSVAENFDGIDEIRPGNYAFYDIMQVQIGSCNVNDIAVALECPIVGIHPKQSEVVIYGGGIHLSKDRMEDDAFGTIYGNVAQKSDNGWNKLIANTYVRGISQEHGIVKVPESDLHHYTVGDTLLVLPVHSCMTADLMKRYKTIDDKEITMMMANL
ncbi:alanine racemase [Pontimicrobium aquaticum]|uniref:Alanine racemase n=1 Tax=Pontimicrobium aquaticum TaxID=2565367 RepID=A0A4U0EX12_9FLAO|nr:alanine racemase [Pontimicrobium aquaticum]TJY36517.1 alanine racemase [Pontimicrobium aquaticum]